MILFKKGKDLHKWLEAQRIQNKSIGFVPTMGALHEGHVSLIHKCRENADIVVCSIYINPTQFNDPSDLEKYPVTLEEDIDALEAAGCDVLFIPSTDEIYPEGPETARQRKYELGELENILEGKFRPGHFQGVCLVVHRLLAIVRPDKLFLGQKDFQQCLVIKRLVKTEQLGCEIVISPTQRESNGLAMSSRNRRLSPEKREKAAIIFKTLRGIADSMQSGSPTETLITEALSQLQNEGLKPEYVEIAADEDLGHIQKWDRKTDAVLLVAAWMDDVRLIDNLIVGAID